ncbi:MAG: STAS domain-containing protein [Nitrospirota bacterium]
MPFELILPKILDEPSFESFLIQAASIVQRQKTLIVEMGPVEAMDPCGMLGLLELGRHLRLRGHRMLLHQPLSADLQQLLERAGFFAQAQPIYTVYPPYRKSIPPTPKKGGDFPLEITPIATAGEITRAVGRLRERMGRPGEAVSAILSALLTKRVEPGGTGGYAVVRSDSSGITIAVSDRGPKVGIQNEPPPAGRPFFPGSRIRVVLPPLA